MQHARGGREIADAVHLAERAFVQVPLHHQLHFAGLLQNLPHLRRVADARFVLGIELLVDNRHARTRGGGKLALQERHLLRRQERLLPGELAAAVGRAVGTVARIEHDELHAPAREGVEGLRRRLAVVRDLCEEFLFRKVVMVVVTEHVVARTLERGEPPFDRAQVDERFGGRPAEVLEVAPFHHEINAEFVHLGGERVHLPESVAVVAQETRLDVRRVVAVGDVAEADHRRGVAHIAEHGHRAGGHHALQKPAPRDTLHRLHHVRD